MSTLFFSYSHVDEGLRDQLEIHLSGLKRQGLISSWHDRRITAGSQFGAQIVQHLEAADVILLLVSPDFIASDYCYNLEMTRGMEKHATTKARVIPIILRPCDWHDLPFGKLQAVPKDGKAISTWPNIDEAFLDVVKAIKISLQEMRGKATAVSPTPASTESLRSATPVIRSSNLHIRKKFTQLDKDRFRHEGFEYIAKFFEGSLLELVSRNPELDQSFRRIDASRFTATAYANGEKVCRGSASISGGMLGQDGIEYATTDDPGYGGMNEAVFVKADDQMLYFEPLGMQYGGNRDKLTFQGAAEFFWDLFIRPLQQ